MRLLPADSRGNNFTGKTVMDHGVELQSRQSGQEYRRAFSAFSGTAIAATFKLNLHNITQHHEQTKGP